MVSKPSPLVGSVNGNRATNTSLFHCVSETSQNHTEQGLSIVSNWCCRCSSLILDRVIAGTCNQSHVCSDADTGKPESVCVCVCVSRRVSGFVEEPASLSAVFAFGRCFASRSFFPSPLDIHAQLTMVPSQSPTLRLS